MKNNFLDKVKEIAKNVLGLLKKHLLVSLISGFVVVAMAVILVATLAMQEFIVPVCVLIMIEAAMAALLRRSELWVHGVVVIIQLLAGFLIGRFLLTALCVVVYVAATVALMLLNKSEQEDEKPKYTLRSKSKSKSKAKAK